MEPGQKQWMYRGAVERYAKTPAMKPKMRFPWGVVIGLLILILVYYYVNKMLF
ncbi:MAG: hypothetical protein V1734_04170 [Nanoarchaeota archaeon]